MNSKPTIKIISRPCQHKTNSTVQSKGYTPIFYHIGETEFDINNNIEQGYCGKFIFMFEGQICPMHHHRKKHETFFIVKGKVEMEASGKKIVMNQGDKKPISQGTNHRFTAKENSLILESSKPDLVDDSIFDDQRINKIIFGKSLH